MDAVKYVKTLHRLCKSQDGCSECVLKSEDGCIAAASRYDKNAVPIVEQWAKDHPVKTRQSEFLKAFPNAPIDKGNGVLFVDPCTVDSTQKGNKYCSISCTTCRKNYWLAEVTDNGND